MFELFNAKLSCRNYIFLHQVLDCWLGKLPGRLKIFNLHTLSINRNKSSLQETHHSSNIIISMQMMPISLTFRISFKKDTNIRISTNDLYYFYSFRIMNPFFFICKKMFSDKDDYIHPPFLIGQFLVENKTWWYEFVYKEVSLSSSTRC